MDRDFVSQLKALASDPLLWREHAVELKLAADALLPQYYDALRELAPGNEVNRRRSAIRHGYLVLVGLAIENALKGLLIAEDPSLVSNDRVSSRILGRGGHGIRIGLALFLSLNAEEEDVAVRLEESLVWAGKYPVPLKADDLANAERNVLRYYDSNDPETIDGIFTRLLELFPSSDSPYAEPSPN